MPLQQSVKILRFTQWLEVWNSYEYDPDSQRRRPDPYIYLFSMQATRLRQFSDVYQREHNVEVKEGIQRAREESRTERIRRYVQYGYPFGDIRESHRPQNETLRKPGWLPTAIVINILTEEDCRRGQFISPAHTASLVEICGNHELRLPNPENFGDDTLRPFEVIDGQHRLWAFDEDDDLSDFEFPVVAFHGLDVAWQAYLFWSINISPKRINPSHAFDLYPLLRTQDWLEKTGEIRVYREARAQEITEWLYRFPESAWHDRISMLQRRGEPRVSQAAWVRSLLQSFFGTGRGRARYGLFQASHFDSGVTLRWERVQQIAFMIEFWVKLKQAIDAGEHSWILLYREFNRDAFTDKSSMLNQDMGVRAVNAVLNDIFFTQSNSWGLDSWSHGVVDKSETSDADVKHAIDSLKEHAIHQYVEKTAKAIAGFDWRSVNGPEVRSSDEETRRRAYRGSGGYTLITRHLVSYISEHAGSDIAEVAKTLDFE